MRRKLAMGIVSVMVLVGTAFVCWGEGAPQTPDPGPGQHQWGEGQHRFADGGHGRFEGRWGGPQGGHRMGWQRGGQMGFGGGGHLLRMAENPRVRQYLGLTDDQVARLHKLGVDAEEAGVKNRAQMEINRIELRELMRADNPDQSAIMAKLDQINELRGSMEKQGVQTFLDARNVLTAEQRAKIKTFMENRGSGMGRRPGMERRGGPGGWGPGHHPGGGTGGPHPNPAPTPPAQQ
jgi:Spy/CpxP family protein refolding chaperone